MSRKSVTIDEMMNDLKLGTSKMPINKELYQSSYNFFLYM